MSKPGINDSLNQLAPGEVLILVPPVAPTGTPSLAAHLLQAGCRRRGINVNVFYANLLFTHLLGFKTYDTISFLNTTNFIGERLFAAAGFGLPPMGRNIHRLIDLRYLPDHVWLKDEGDAAKKMSGYLGPVAGWIISMNWMDMVDQVTGWIKSLAKQICRTGYRIVGCTNSHGGLVPPITLLKYVKQFNPNIITVLGGFHCEGEMAEGILSLDTSIDYIFSGESDITFPVFVQNIFDGKRPEERIINGKEVMDLAGLPVPDYREFFQQAEAISLKPYPGDKFPILYETSRGCWYKKCTFCGLNGEKESYRTKSPDQVMVDLEILVKRHPSNPVNMVDSSMPLEYAKTLFPRISKRFPTIRIRYVVNTSLSLGHMIALKQAGAYQVQPGFESLSPGLLKRMRKPADVRQNLALLRYARSVGMNLNWNLLFGIPGDILNEYEEMLELIPLIHHLPPPVTFCALEIHRFSKYQRSPEEFGISNLRPAALYKDVLPTHVDLKKIAYFFTADFKAQSYEHPSILARLRKAFHRWVNAWEPGEANPAAFEPPKLHLEEEAHGQYVLHDTRGLPGSQERLVVDREKASILLLVQRWDDSPPLRWAIDAKLAVLRDSWCIPLATADTKIQQEFERDYSQEPNK
ncbi:MAG: RiPP maturation radical SAM C-methyltransferase [Candidatus Aminicenantes bacterium]|nr:RiPP maturation radical SAM C-methyltransferase [Candidatus Aminicenantes bacterium]